jgi:hypothetical protein
MCATFILLCVSLTNFPLDVTVQVNCCIGYITWICLVSFFFILERVCFLVVKLFIQAYSFHKADSPLRLCIL